MGREQFFKYKYSTTQYFKDFVCCYFDIDTTQWSVTVKEDTLVGEGVNSLLQTFEQLIETFKKKNKSNKTSKFVVYMNQLHLCKVFLQDFDGVPLNFTNYDTIDEHRIELEFETMHIQWRNFTAICNTKDISDVWKMFPYCTHESDCMKEFVMSWGEKIPAKNVRYSMAHTAKRATMKPIQEVCRKNMRVYYPTMTHYNDMTEGSKSGMIFSNDNYFWQELHGVVSFDIKSAYTSVLVNDSKFPIGKIKPYGTWGRPDWACAEMRRRTEDGIWTKIVIPSETRIDFLSDMYKSRYSNTYGLEYYDLESLRLFNKDAWLELIKYLEKHRDWRMYTSEGTGYLLKEYRERNAGLYLEKESIKDKTNPKRVQTKNCLEMGYGKSIQKQNFTDIEQVNNYYSNRGDNYLLPQHGMHCVAATKYRAQRLMLGCADKVVAFDTDGVRFKQLTEDVQRCVDRENALVLQCNKDAGFEGLNIGVWEQEYIADRFVQFKTKTYWYETNGNLTCKMAGIQQDEIKSYLKQHQDPIQEILQNGHTFKMQSNYTYDPNTQQFTKHFTDYDLRNPN